MRRLRVDVIVVLGLALFAAGFLLGRTGTGTGIGTGGPDGSASHATHGTRPGDTSRETVADERWTCSMHPQIQLPEFGKCPICHMDLIPVEGGGDASGVGASRIELSEAALALADVRTVRVQRRYPTMQLRLVGKVAIDETRRRSITAYTSGRLDRLYVDTVGTPIRKNDHLVWIYSPELVSAQQEYLQAKQAAARAGEGLLAESSRRTVESAREKLRLLGLTEAQLRELDAKGEVEDHVTIYAPMDGVVLARRAVQGSYVKTGEVIYEIADLSRVWVLLEAYESDLPWLRYGQSVRFELPAHPGREFEGSISFVDPILDPVTRTARVRVAVDNADGLLKPGLFVRARAAAAIGEGGRVMDEDLEGKWISPMHPEVIKDGPGTCDVCGMDLVPIEEMGYVPGDADAPLVIPASAPLLTGERAVVYVRRPGEGAVFEMREVHLGPRAGDWYLVTKGLREGEEVVENGAFKLDSAVQISGRPSMMSGPTAGGTSTSHASEGDGHPDHASVPDPALSSPEFRARLDAVFTHYDLLVAALAADDGDEAAKQWNATAEAVAQLDPALVPAAHRGHAQLRAEALGVALEESDQTAREGATRGIATMRAALPVLSEALAQAVRDFGLPAERSVRRMHCPMAFDDAGADWLQSASTLANPYFGATMLRCGAQVEVLQEGAQTEALQEEAR